MTDNLFTGAAHSIIESLRPLIAEIGTLPEDARIEAINEVKKMLHEISPFRNEPVDCVLWVPAEMVRGNDYNPNSVAPPEMRLLEHSIASDGYTQPIVAYDEGDGYTIVDGFHRHQVGKESAKVKKRIKGYLPITVIRTDRTSLRDRIAATIRHNRARGVHGVMPMTEVVATLLREGWTDDEIAKELGMDPDEVLRFKQNTGLPELFAHHSYSKAWE